MSEPKFAVGEIVVLQSVNLPHLNGEHAVAHIVSPGDTYQGFVVGSMESGFGYDLGIAHPVGGSRIFSECALRKRHTPGEYSFDALKQILAMPVDKRDFA